VQIRLGRQPPGRPLGDVQGARVDRERDVAVRGHRRHMRICQSENRGLGIQIDPSGSAAPLLYEYPGQPAPGACAEFNIWYPVRKFRFVSHDNTTGEIDGVRPWQVTPLPRPDW
jgi:hypothetical protein